MNLIDILGILIDVCLFAVMIDGVANNFRCTLRVWVKLKIAAWNALERNHGP